MEPRLLRELLERVQAGALPVEDAMRDLESLPFRDLGFATVDHHRSLRQGVPEVIFGQGKTSAQIIAIAREIRSHGADVLVTRLDDDKAHDLCASEPAFIHSKVARTARLVVTARPKRPAGAVAVVTAGTSDIPVAEEAVETLLAIGLEPVRTYDVGVAGIHRLLSHAEDLRRAAAVIVIAGMEGALPSVVGGIVSAPIVAVPTSVGYGTALGGFTALFAMLTSCASGIVVVNIDSGFGAAMAVHRMLPRLPGAGEG